MAQQESINSVRIRRVYISRAKFKRGNMMSRQEAKELGLKRYRDGGVCSRGHINPERLTSCGRCYECHVKKKHERWAIAARNKKLREELWGYDPTDLRYRRKERGIQLSDRPDLVKLREKKKRKKLEQGTRIPMPEIIIKT